MHSTTMPDHLALIDAENLGMVNARQTICAIHHLAPLGSLVGTDQNMQSEHSTTLYAERALDR